LLAEAVVPKLTKGTIGADGCDIKLEENTENETVKIRVAVITAAIGIEYRFSFEGSGVEGCGHQFLRFLINFRILIFLHLLS
jgi:hypothetical protein